MNGVDSEHDRDRRESGSPSRDGERLYLYIPSGQYDMPRQTLPMDMNVLERVIPGSQIRSMTGEEYRRLKDLQKERKDAS